MGNRTARIIGIAALWGVAASARLGAPLPETVRFAAALAAVAVLPGWWIASSILPGEGRRRRIPLAWAASQAVIALLAVLWHLAGLPLERLLWPLGVLGIAAALRGGSGTRRDTGAMIGVTAAALLTVAVARPADGPISDAYDHTGAVRHMIVRGDPLPRESFHADRIVHLDPRKGTNHTAWALAGRLAGTDPTPSYPAFWAFQVWMTLLVLLWLAESVLPGRAEAAAGAICFALLYRGGPGDEWFWTSGYPGKAGLLLFFLALALALRSGREDEEGRGRLQGAAVLLGAGAAGIHAFAGLLVPLGGALVAASCLLSRGLRGRSGGPLRFLAALTAGAAPLLLFRYLFTYDPANPLHLHRQGSLILGGRLSLLEPTELLRTATLAGALSLVLLPLLFERGRAAAPGEILLVLAPLLVLLLVANPVLHPWLEERGSYLTRRIPLVAPYPLVLGAVMVRGWRRRGNRARGLGGAAAVLAVLLTVHSGYAAHRTRSTALARERGNETEALLRTASAVPAGSTVLADPLTGYTLYGKAPLHIAAVPDQHSSPNDPDGTARVRETQRVLHGLAGPAETDRILDRYGAEYVLVNESYEDILNTYNVFVSPEAFARGLRKMEERPDRFLPLPSEPGFRLFRVRPGGGEAGADPPRADRSPTGPPIDADLPGGFRLLAGALDRERARPGGIVTLTTLWEVREEGPDARPPILFVRARREGDPDYESWSLRRDPVLRPWSIGPLGTVKDPAYLWRGGDRAREVRSIRVPRSAPPGAYRLEITVEPDPFFPVRRADGLRRGAIRETWIAVDTLEVGP